MTEADYWQQMVFEDAGMPSVLIAPLINLLALHAMEAYRGMDGHGGVEWRVQLKRDSYRLKYVEVPYAGVLVEHWISTVKEVEARYAGTL